MKKFLRVRLDDFKKNKGRCRRSWLVLVERILIKYGWAVEGLGQEDGKIMSDDEWGEWWELVKKDIWRAECEKWKVELSRSGKKCELYRGVKVSLGREKYVEVGRVFDIGELVRIRAGVAELREESGRWEVPKMKWEDRVCQICECGKVENVEHFVNKCKGLMHSVLSIEDPDAFGGLGCAYLTP